MKIRVMLLPNGQVRRILPFSGLYFFDLQGNFLYHQSTGFTEWDEAIKDFINNKYHSL